MEIGELVRHTTTEGGCCCRVFMHKMWRTEHRGTNVDFSKIQPEPLQRFSLAAIL